jgi:transposase
LITLELTVADPWRSREIEVYESYLSGYRTVKRGHGAAGKVPVFGLFKRGDKIHIVILPNAQQNNLILIIRRAIEKDSFVYAHGFLTYQSL